MTRIRGSTTDAINKATGTHSHMQGSKDAGRVVDQAPIVADTSAHIDASNSQAALGVSILV
ncbi:MAG: hypothetical protein WAU02_04510 [Candidatus Saccharimonadales bacterium]